MSRFSCDINVLSEGACECCWPHVLSVLTRSHIGTLRDSNSLVPGDVVSLTQPSLTTFPADFLLLSGDAIVNESMLTGESVPVSKIPVKDQVLAKWRDAADVTPECAKSFLYAGTRVVRVRSALSIDGTPTGPALALVVRTGKSPL